MESRQQGYAQVTAAAKAGLSERSGRDIELGKRPSAKPTKRHWRTRADPLEAVWDTELLLMLERSPDLQPITLLEYLQSRYEGMYPDKVLRTLQRRIKTWQALHGHEKVVMFRQSHVSGRMGLSDFTTLKKISITINAEPFEHLLYHFRLAFSHWSYMKVIQGGESFTALAQGLQEALRRLGGAPLEHRTDSLSAAFKNLTQDEGDDITSRYDALCKHYGMTATRNNRGCCHENGSIESPHGHLKRRIQQALILRGSCDFSCVAAWQQFIDDVVQGHNRRHAKAVVEERLSLQPLPHYGATDYTELSVVVSRSSTIDVRRVTYTVPSRLQGETLHIHLYDNKLVCFLGHVFLMELTRLHPKKNMRARQVDYRHVIHSLVKKPQAFRYATLRQELLPNADYQTIWTHLDTTRPPKEACKVMVGILHLAAKEDCEETLGKFVLTLIEHAGAISLRSLQGHFTKQPTSIPEIAVMQHGLAYYNRCIPMHQEVIHA